ncbi:MAG: two-component sensor histidine kinase, partial [Gorillibacterium sp.]|nr:two-component sensor histidine kinase [Gorillibacterium sp.]
AEIIEERLFIAVEDNGGGISGEKLDEINRAFRDTDDREEYRIGLRNVHQRLILTYGESSGLVIASEPGLWTRISFSIPIGGLLHVQSIDSGR